MNAPIFLYFCYKNVSYFSIQGESDTTATPFSMIISRRLITAPESIEPESLIFIKLAAGYFMQPAGVRHVSQFFSQLRQCHTFWC